MKAQAFTLEGVMASLLLLIVVYTFFQSSLVISPMWSELSDAQLRLLAQDTLKILDNPDKVDGNYINATLQGMISQLNSSFEPNPEFLYALDRVTFPADYRLELYWVEGGGINGTAIVDNDPTPEAVGGSRFVVIEKDDLSSDSPFKNNPEISDPVVFEVRLILWRP